MLIIPVIDLSRGLVVHAKYGERNTYQPIKSVISASAVPEVVLSSFLELYPFKTIYIADLDAIQETGSNKELILELASDYKQCEFWLDAGIKAIQDKPSNYSADNIKLILGSENKLSQKSFYSLINNNPDVVLSLDFIEHELIENNYLLSNTSNWPKDLIVMNLSRVGSNKGIDKQCLINISNITENKNIYAAGGIRNMNDINALNAMNIKGVLLASALHSGAITKEDLEQFFDQ